MYYLKLIYVYFLCLITAKENSAAVYMIDFPNVEDTALQNNYDDYDPINEYVDSEQDFDPIPSHQLEEAVYLPSLQVKQLSMPIKTDLKKIWCHKVYGSIYGNNQYIRCKNKSGLRRPKRSEWKQKVYQFEYPDYNRIKFSQDQDASDLGSGFRRSKRSDWQRKVYQFEYSDYNRVKFSQDQDASDLESGFRRSKRSDWQRKVYQFEYPDYNRDDFSQDYLDVSDLGRKDAPAVQRRPNQETRSASRNPEYRGLVRVKVDRQGFPRLRNPVWFPRLDLQGNLKARLFGV